MLDDMLAETPERSSSGATDVIVLLQLHLQDAVDGPEGEEPGHGVSGAEGDVDGSGGDEAAGQHDARGGARAQHSAHKLGEPVGDGEQRCQGPDL